MAFPSNPTNNQLYTRFGRQYIYDSAKGVWKNHNVEPILNTANIDNLVDVDTTTVTPTAGQTLVWDDVNNKWKPGDVASGGSGLEYQSVQTADFTASAGNLYPIDTTSNTVTVTLPASPSTGDRIGIIDYAGKAATNSIEIDSNSLKINGVAYASSFISTTNAAVTLIYTGSDMGWAAESGFNITNIQPPINVEYLIVAGGGGGGSAFGGGGGAGGVLTGTTTVSTEPYSIVIGAGATQSAVANSVGGSNGSNSSALGFTAIGGGGGGSYTTGVPTSGGSGGGGGSSEGSQTHPGEAGTTGQGNAGGYGYGKNGYLGGGGGGAGAPGGNAVANSTAGNGGAGLQSSISGTATYYAGGGGGGAYTYQNGTIAGTGGAGGGGAGSGGNATRGTAATANTGGGGGGGGYPAGGGGAGGSGIVIIATPYYKPISNIGVGLTYTLDTSSRVGYYVYTFTAGTGSISW